MIKELRYKDYTMVFDVDKWKTAPEIKTRLSAIREGKATDKYDWMYKV